MIIPYFIHLLIASALPMSSHYHLMTVMAKVAMTKVTMTKVGMTKVTMTKLAKAKVVIKMR